MIDGREDVTVVGIVVLALDGEHGNAVVANEAGGHIVLGRQRIRGAQRHVGAAVFHADREVCGLCRYVQACGNPHALERLVLDEFLADDLQHLHRLIGPVNPLAAHIG
jgi:hypothetical protein